MFNVIIAPVSLIDHLSFAEELLVV